MKDMGNNGLKEKIAETRDRLNNMEFVDELDNTDIKRLAQRLYYEKLTDGVGPFVSDAVDKYFSDLYVRLNVANGILEDMELEPIECRPDMTLEEIFDEYISRFQTYYSINGK